MRIVQINAVCGRGSTGRICISISDILNERGIENYILYSSGKSLRDNAIKCSNKLYTKFQAAKAKLMGNYGFNSAWETRRIIRQLERIRPTIVHLHNIHGHDCHLEYLFDYFKKKRIKVFWTFHDCWAFTGYCTHFTFEECNKWKTECAECPQRRLYSFFWDRSRTMYRRKKTALSGVNLTIITPSEWLADLVSRSFLKDYPIKVIRNGINLDVFKPAQSDFRRKYGITDEKSIVLGVASDWGVKKGLDTFIELTQRLNPQKYQIVLVGTDERVDHMLPETVLSIRRTNSQQELAEIYAAADVFVNPTKEDTYPTVNMEAIACGIPVITFSTGGSPEILDNRTGVVVPFGDLEAMTTAIMRLCENKPYMPEDFEKRALSFNMKDCFKEYVALYEKV